MAVESPLEVIIVGGGPAGLSAALILGRCRRRVLVCDAGQPRNRSSSAVHGFLTCDGIAPKELLKRARDQLQPYSNVTLRDVEAVDAEPSRNGFLVTLSDQSQHEAAKLLLATGVVDQLPAIPGIDQFYGRSVHHCPYCDGWEWRDQPLAVYGKGEKGSGLALMLTLWSKDVVLCTDGADQISEKHRAPLNEHGIGVRHARIIELHGTADGVLEHIEFADGDRLPRRAMFFNTGSFQRSPLISKLGCIFSERGRAQTGDFEETNVSGLFVIGDASGDVQLVVNAAAEGARAAFAVNKALMHDAGLI